MSDKRMLLGSPYLFQETAPTESNDGYNSDDFAGADGSDVITTAYTPEAPTGVVPKTTAQLEAEAYVPPVRASKLATIGGNMLGMGVAAWQTTESWMEEKDYNFNPTPLITALGIQMGGLSQKRFST